MSDKPALAAVSTIYDHTLHDVPAVLRAIATEIEAGKYGDVGCAVVVVLGDELSVHSMGADSAAPSAYITLVGGCRQLEETLLDHGRPGGSGPKKAS